MNAVTQVQPKLRGDDLHGLAGNGGGLGAVVG
jgi:hypothetical protein